MLADSGPRSQIQATPMKKKPKPPRRPGDLILDKYMPDATPIEREEARFNLRQLALLIIDTNKRLDEEKRRTEAGLELGDQKSSRE